MTDHGSDIRTSGLHGVALAPTFRAASHMRPDRDFKTDADRTVADLRGQMTGTRRGVMQVIKNIFGRCA